MIYMGKKVTFRFLSVGVYREDFNVEICESSLETRITMSSKNHHVIMDELDVWVRDRFDEAITLNFTHFNADSLEFDTIYDTILRNCR